MSIELWTVINFLGGVVVGSVVFQYAFWGIGMPRWGWNTTSAFLKCVGLAAFVVVCAGVVYALFMSMLTPWVLGM